MDLGESLHGAVDQEVQLGGARKGNAGEMGQLVETDDQGRRTRESADDGLGDEMGQETQAEGAEQELNASCHEGEEKGEFDVAIGSRHSHRSQSGCDQQGIHGGRSHSQLSGGSHDSIDHLGHEGSVEPVDHRKAGNHGIGHALWDEHDPDREACREVLHPIAASVIGNPA